MQKQEIKNTSNIGISDFKYSSIYKWYIDKT